MNERGRLSTGCAVLLGIAAFTLFVLWMRGCWYSPWEHGGRWPVLFSSPGLGFFGRPFGLLSIWGLIQIALAVWVGVDADRRGQNGWLWGLLVFFTGIVGLIVYLLVVTTMGRGGPLSPAEPAPAAPPPVASRECPGCRARVQASYKACPYCGRPLRCARCDKPIEGGWKLCPYCTAPLEGGAG